MNRYKKYLKNNELLNENISYNGEINNPTEIKYINYNVDDVEKGNIELSEKINIKENFINWIIINGFNDMQWIIETLESIGIPKMGIMELFQPQGMSNVYSYNDLYVINTKLIDMSDRREKHLDQLSIILGKNFIITLQEKDSTIFDDITGAISNNIAKVRNRNVNYLFFVLLNHVLSIYTTQLQALKDNFEDMEDELLENYNTEDDFRNRLKNERKLYQTLKQHIVSLKIGIMSESYKECGLFEKKDKLFFNSIREQMNYQNQLLDICRETFSLLFNLYISNNDLRMNEIMKRLTVISAIFIPLTFLAGVWGMNFKFMPELEFGYGYLLAWGTMILIALLSWWYMRKRKWY